MKSKSAWLFEFSKKVVRIIIGLYVAHIAYCDIAMLYLEDISQMGETTHELTLVTLTCLSGYLFKATLENVFKIKDHYDSER